MSDESRSQFVDTNILVYAYDVSAGKKHDTAKALIQSLWQSRLGYLSLQVLQEFYVTVTRKVPSPYLPEEAANIIDDLSVWQIHSPTANDVLEAIKLQTRYQFSFWDAMILQSANVLGCEVVWTEDLSHGQTINQTLIRNPFIF